MDFERVYEAYFQPVYRYLMTLCKNEHIAQELTSETFFKAMQAIDRFRGECELSVWLCQIAKNCYYTYLKKVGQTDYIDDTELSELPSGESTIEEQCIKHEESTQIRTVLHHVPEPYKEVFMWRVFAELSFKQIGQIFGKSENWACVTYHRAKAMIKSRLEDKTYEK